MVEKDVLLLGGVLASLVVAPKTLAEVPEKLVSQSESLTVRENERFSFVTPEVQLEESPARSLQLSSLYNPENIIPNNPGKVEKIPSLEFSSLSSQQLPSVNSAPELDNTKTTTLKVFEQDNEANDKAEKTTVLPIANNAKLSTLKLDNNTSESNNQINKSTPTAVAEIPPLTGQSSSNSNNSTLAELSEERAIDDPLGQVNSVSQLSDVQPTDWAFEALKNLIERYGCIAGYPDGTFRGNRALTRFEFAAGLNACLTQVEKLVAGKTVDFARKEDLTTLQRLIDEFQPELTSLRSRVDNLEARTTKLENQRFSTTALLGGEVIFGLATAGGGNPPGTGKANAVFNHLTRLQVVTTFTGLDRLRLELSAGNFSGLGFANPQILNTYTSLLSYQQDTGNGFELSSLEYRFAAFNNRAVFTLKPVGFSLGNVLSPNSPYFDTGRGSISRFGEANPIFKIGALNSGVGLDWLLTKRTRLQVAYGTSKGNEPSEGFLFSGSSNVVGAQILTLLGNDALTGFTLVYGSSSNGRLNTYTGSAIADASGFMNLPANIYALGGTLQWRITPTLTFSTWGGLTFTYAAQTNAFAATNNFMFALGFSDPFGRQGDLFALMVGQPPRLVQAGGYVGANGGLLENGRSLHLEAFYRFAVTKRISITPGFFIVTNPGNIEDNNAIYVGVIRSTFRF